jgi:hypothetical protein
VPASGDNEDDCGEQMECRLAGETEVLGENLPKRHFCSSQNPKTVHSFDRLATVTGLVRYYFFVFLMNEYEESAALTVIKGYCNRSANKSNHPN